MRGEPEMTSINQAYLERGDLSAEWLGRGFVCLDTETLESLLEASHYVKTIEEPQGCKMACLEEVAFKNGWLSIVDLKRIGQTLGKNTYGKYLLSLAEESK